MLTTGPLLSFGCEQLFYFLALVVKPSPYRFLFILPVTAAVAAFFLYNPRSQDPLDWLLAGIVVFQFFAASDYILLTEVQCELHFDGQKTPAYRLPLLDRVKWAAKLFFSQPCVGWSHGSPHALQPRFPPSVSRPRFILNQLRRLSWEVARFEVVRISYMWTNPCFRIHGKSMAEDGIFRLFLNFMAFIAWFFTHISLVYRGLVIACVGSGLKEPEEFAPLFGSWLDCYSLKRFWGRVCHQAMRGPLTSHGRFLAYDVLHLKKDSRASYLVQLYAAFAISGLIHLCADYSILGHWSYRAFCFFILQAVGITIELIAVDITKTLSIPDSWYWIGYIWVHVWGMMTVPIWFDPLFRAGIGDMSVRFGILGLLLKLVVEMLMKFGVMGFLFNLALKVAIRFGVFGFLMRWALKLSIKFGLLGYLVKLALHVY